MIIITEKNITKESYDIMVDFFKGNNIVLKNISDEAKKIFLASGDTSVIDEQSVLRLPGVISCHRITVPYHLVSRENHPENTIVKVKDLEIGGKNVVIMAGPCSIEGEEETLRLALKVKDSGARVLRGGAYKPRTSPYFFQGIGSIGLDYLAEAGKKANMPVISEIVNPIDIPSFLEKVDIIQVGARNMQNYELLKALGRINKPVMLKRGPSSTIEQWLLSAEYIVSNGNPNVILCERGIKTFTKMTRNTLDLSSVPLIKKLSHLPIVVDPSHATGDYSLVESMTLAAIASGADGVIIEVHENPLKALSDGNQALKVEKLKGLIEKGKAIAQVLGRDI